MLCRVGACPLYPGHLVAQCTVKGVVIRSFADVPFFGPIFSLGLLGFSFAISYASGLPGAFAMGYYI